ncbi:ankyrin repeat domain-containing protein [uncultured Flavobacterium sp.]|uniref:ankyrin repeat domain-containing protein n=1 Tax=uncultured Flavobacterium sp. TaxID=165435 RepID=UPI0025EEAEA8|nr:ankyrin repeat domain-containing protein [uncultured Flavobacterium sp.]
MPKKRKTLPKDFSDILKRGNIDELIAVFEKCELDAYGGYGKQTALGFTECPPEFDKWLVGQGLDIEAVNDYGYTPLQHRSEYWAANIKSLLELGASVHANNKKGTALHCAAKGYVAEHVKTLLEYGADVNAPAPEPFSYGGSGATATPLEYSLAFCGNSDIVNTVEIARMLLAAGALKTEKMKDLVTKIGIQFEHHRSGFNKEYVQEYSDALDELYVLFGVTPVPQKVLHDGKSKITVKAGTWQKQFNELWELLIPSSGTAQTMQGEVIRIAGRISDELKRNGGINWDDDYKVMADSFLEFIQTGQSLSREEIDETAKIVSEVKRRTDKNVNRLAHIAVLWVLANPIPVPAPAVNYDR